MRCLLALCFVSCLATSAIGQERTVDEQPRLARPRASLSVADFATDRTGWMPPPHLGATLAELLTDRLVTSGAFRMVDREWLISAPGSDQVIPFDVLRARAADAGVDYLVAGAVTRLSNERHSSTVGGLLPLPIVGGLVRKQKTEQVIALTIRVICVSTGEIVATATAESSSSNGQSSGGGVAVVGHLPVPLFVGKGGSATGIADRLLAEAVRQAISLAAERIVAAAPHIAQ